MYYPFSGPGSLNNNAHCWSTPQLLAGQAVAASATTNTDWCPTGSTLGRASRWALGEVGPGRGNFFDVTLRRRPADRRQRPEAPSSRSRAG